MLSAVLQSKIAVEVSVRIMDAFVEARKFIANHRNIFSQLNAVESRQLKFESETTKNFEKVFSALEGGKAGQFQFLLQVVSQDKWRLYSVNSILPYASCGVLTTVYSILVLDGTSSKLEHEVLV